MKLFVYLIVCCFFFEKRSIGQDSTVVLHVNPYEATGGAISQVFEEVQYIPLETNKRSLFGKIDQLVITDSYFIIRDRNTTSILIFDHTGKFHNRIRKVESVFAVNRSMKEIAFKTDLYKIAYYNFDGKKVREETTQSGAVHFWFFSRDSAVYSDYNVLQLQPDTIDYELKYVTRNKIYRQEFPFNKRSAVLQSSDISYPDHSPFYETGNSNLVFYWRPYEYNVYAVTPASVTRQYSLVFPLSLSLPAGFITDSALAGKRMRYINANKKVIFDLSYVYRLGNSLFFKIGTLDPGLTDNCALVYNMKSGSLLSIAHISPDSSNYFLPLGDIDFTSTEFANDNFYTCDGKYVYTAHSSLQMFRARALTRSKNVKYNQVLKNYFLKEDKDSNPVIIRLRPRENY